MVLQRAEINCAGTTMKSNRRQRVALVSHMLDMIKNVLLPFMEKSGDKEITNNLSNFVIIYQWDELCCAPGVGKTTPLHRWFCS
jgi:hypothetical protein